MREKRLTTLILLTIIAAACLLSSGVQDVRSGLVAWALFATLAVLLTLYSVRTRWYLRGLVRPPRDDRHAGAQDPRPKDAAPAYMPTWPCCPPRPRM